MRALCDAVLVGAETVIADDPRLTTRLVAGGSPVRVVLDPRRRLPSQRRVFTDGRAPTLVLCAVEGMGQEPQRIGGAEIVGVPTLGGRLDLGALLRLLHGRGLRLVFIEGGGVTVSAFLEAGLLDRLQVAVAPLLIGDGRPGVSLRPTASLGECLRPRCRAVRRGADVLFDCEPGKATTREGDGGPGAALARIF
jgi:riboflavin-specific deaminase-like protein